MKELIFETSTQWPGFILRMVIGLVMFPHGAQKMLGMFGGYGYVGTMHFFTQNLKLPWMIAFLVIIIEFFGPLCLLAGFASRLWSIALIVLMLGAIVTTNYKNGFFMNWFGNQPGEGYEYHLLMIGICMAILATGSGRFSLDGLLTR